MAVVLSASTTGRQVLAQRLETISYLAVVAALAGAGLLHATVAAAHGSPEPTLASRTLEGLDTPAERAAAMAVVEFANEALRSPRLARQLSEFGLTPDTVSDVISTRLDETFVSSVGSMTEDIVFSIAVDVTADAVADAVFATNTAQKIPQSLQNPARALVRSSIAEGLGLAKTVTVDAAQLGPLALISPAIQRVQDIVEIVEASEGVDQARTEALTAAALGAEIAADLQTRYPNADSFAVISRWRAATLENLRGLPGVDSLEIEQVLTLGIEALVEQRLSDGPNGGQAEVNAMLALLDDPGLRESADDAGFLGAFTNIVSGSDPTETFIRAFALTTSLSQIGTGTPQPGASSPALSTWVWRGEADPMDTRDQDARRKAICNTYTDQNKATSGDIIARELSGLTDWYRSTSLNCLLPRQSFVIPIDVQARIVGRHSSENRRRQMLCRLMPMLPVGQSAGAVAEYLTGLNGWERRQAIGCLKDKIAEGVSVNGMLQLLGPLMPELAADWNGTLAKYRHADHSASVCHIAPLLVESISAEDTSKLLGLARNYERMKVLNCLLPKIKAELTWDEVETIVRPSFQYVGQMIDNLGDKTPDGRNFLILEKALKEYPGRKFLVSPDPPEWLDGQCVAFVDIQYQLVASGQDVQNYLAQQVGGAGNILEFAAKSTLTIEEDPTKARIGAIAVWRNGTGYGHAGIVTAVRRDRDSEAVLRVSVAEANWGRITETGARKWGTSLEIAEEEFITEMYGRFAYSTLDTSDMIRSRDSGSPYQFAGYVLP